MIVNSKEELELEKTLGTISFLIGEKFTFENITLYNEKRVRSQAFLDNALLFSPVMKNSYQRLLEETNASVWLSDIQSKRKKISSNIVKYPSSSDAMDWFYLMTEYAKLILRLETIDANRIKLNIDEVLRRSNLWLIIRSLLVCFALLVVPFIIISLVRVQNHLYKYAHSLHHKVCLEQSRTEFLLKENSRHVQGL